MACLRISALETSYRGRPSAEVSAASTTAAASRAANHRFRTLPPLGRRPARAPGGSIGRVLTMVLPWSSPVRQIQRGDHFGVGLVSEVGGRWREHCDVDFLDLLGELAV
jgi:hypothetical protein